MAFTNYGELKTAIATRLSRSDMTSQIPDFITLARDRLILGDEGNGIPPVRIDEMLTKDESLALATGVADLSGLANTYLQRHSLFLDDADETPITFMPAPRFNRLGSKTQAGTPAFYTVVKKTLQVAPYSSDDIKFTYYSVPAAMSDDADADVYLTKSPRAYFYGALAEAYAAIRQFDTAAMYMTQFRSAVMSMNEDADSEEFGGDALAMFADRVV